MALKALILALSMTAVISPVAAAQPEPIPMVAAPAGSPLSEYCMRIEPVTGSRIESIECWTRAEWAEQGVDVDAEWAEEGVEVRG